MSEPAAPLLVVDVPFARPRWLRQWVLAVVLGLGGATFAVLARDRALPWLPEPMVQAMGSRWGRRLVFAVVAAAAFAAYYATVARLRRRAGRFELHADRVVVVRPTLDDPDEPSTAEVAWSDLRGFRDAATDHVVLVPGDEAEVAVELALPTPTEADRVTLLALLDARGLPRLDA